MRIHMDFLCFSVMVLGAGSRGAAPAGAARELVPGAGSRIPFRVGLPAGAQVEDDGRTLAAWTDSAIVMVDVVDLMEEEQGWREAVVSEPEARRIMTGIILDSDALLLRVRDDVLGERKMALREVETDFRTLDGRRAAYVGGRFSHVGASGWIEVYVSIKDAVVYTLGIVRGGDDREAFQSLARRIHASFRMADGPPA